MAAPNQGQSAPNVPQPRSPSIYTPPRSQEEVLREQKRVNLLLEINSLLLQHISQLQGEGMGGLVTAPPQAAPDQANQPKMASQEYILCLRCMQANITWLAASASGVPGNARSFSGPALMDSPVDTPTLVQKYEDLKRLFPNWRGTMNARPSAAQGSQAAAPGQGQMQPQAQIPQQNNPVAPGAMPNQPSG